MQNYKFENCCSNCKSILLSLRKFNPLIIYDQENTDTKAKYALNDLNDSFKSLSKYIQELIKLIRIPEKTCTETKSFTEPKYLFSNILKVAIPKINSYPNVGFKEIKNYNSLVYQIISAEEQSKKLICSLNKINIYFKPIIGPLYTVSNYTLSFISSMNEKLDLKIEYTQDFYQRYFYKEISNELIEIKIKVPELEENEEKDTEIKGNFRVISKNYSEINILYTLSFKILPIQILFSCNEYLIAFKNGSYYLCVDRIISNTSLHFSVKYYNSTEKVIQKISLISLEENKAPIPSLKNDNPENIELKIIGSKKPIRLQCLTNFAFSKNLIIPLNIDAAVIPFDFDPHYYFFMKEEE